MWLETKKKAFDKGELKNFQPFLGSYTVSTGTEKLKNLECESGGKPPGQQGGRFSMFHKSSLAADF